MSNVGSISSTEVITLSCDTNGNLCAVVYPCINASTCYGFTMTGGALPGTFTGVDAADAAVITANCMYIALTGVELTLTYVGDSQTQVKGTVQIGSVQYFGTHAGSNITTILDEPFLGTPYPTTLNESKSIHYRPPKTEAGRPGWAAPASDVPSGASRPLWPTIVIAGTGMVTGANTALYRLKIVRKYDMVPVSGGVLRNQVVNGIAHSGAGDIIDTLWQKTAGAWEAAPSAIRSAGADAAKWFGNNAIHYLGQAATVALPALLGM